MPNTTLARGELKKNPGTQNPGNGPMALHARLCRHGPPVVQRLFYVGRRAAKLYLYARTSWLSPLTDR